MEPTWQTEDGSVRLYLADCMSVLTRMMPGDVDAIVTDPPYGIGEAAGRNKSRSVLAVSRDYGDLEWDDQPASWQSIEECQRVSDSQIIFGGNYFTLPPSSCWLVWDKLNGANDFADCELAWTNLKKAVRRIQFRWHGMIRDEDGDRVHPTQKPIGVMEWAISHLPPSTRIVCDPFMGSGTTGVAAVRAGLAFLGVEREPAYFDIAVKRIEAELNRAPLFDAAPAVVQRELL